MHNSLIAYLESTLVVNVDYISKF